MVLLTILLHQSTYANTPPLHLTNSRRVASQKPRRREFPYTLFIPVHRALSSDFPNWNPKVTFHRPPEFLLPKTHVFSTAAHPITSGMRAALNLRRTSCPEVTNPS